MALVTITGNAWDHSGKVIPAELMPRLWATPLDDRVSGGLLTGTKSRATLHPVTGAFTVEVESDLDYRMEMDWLIPGQQYTETGDYARSFAQWPRFNAAGGGPIGSLILPKPSGVIVAETSPPPESAERMVWIDLTDVTSEGVQVYAPDGS